MLGRGVEIDYVAIDEAREGMLAAEAGWPMISGAEADRTAWRTQSKLQAVHPEEYRGYRVTVVVYAKCLEEPGEALALTPEDLPWAAPWKVPRL